MRQIALTTALVSGSLVTSASASQELHSFSGFFFDQLGGAVSAGDVNGDGIDDILMTLPGDESFGFGDGSVMVRSGVDGSLIHQVGTNLNNGFANSVAAIGDLNSDGREEFIVGAWLDDTAGNNAGRVFVYNGLDAGILHSVDGATSDGVFGYSLDAVGDANLDGTPDFVVGAPNAGINAGTITMISGLDYSVLWTVQGESDGLALGRVVRGAGDVNGDGRGDVIAGVEFDHTIAPYAGSARVYSGLDGTLLHTFYGPAENDHGGRSVDSAGDVNGDGHDDLIVAATGNDEGADLIGLVRVFSGMDGALLHSFHGFGVLDGLGAAVAGVGDMDGDGFDDIAMSSDRSDVFGHFAGYVRVHSGLTGNVLHLWQGPVVEGFYGMALTGSGDMNGDGVPDLIVGSPRNEEAGTESGNVTVLSGEVALAQQYCFADGVDASCPCGNLDPDAGCANSTGSGALVIASGSSSVSADDLILTAIGVPTNQSGVMFMGVSAISTPFNGGSLCCGGPLQRFPVKNSGPSGVLTYGPGLPPMVDITGLATSYFQAWFRDSGGPCGAHSNVSSAVEVNWLP